MTITQAQLDKIKADEAQLKADTDALTVDDSPVTVTPPSGQSPDGTTSPTPVIDPAGSSWTLAAGTGMRAVLKNGAQYLGGIGDIVMMDRGVVKVHATDLQWYSPAAEIWVGATPPASAAPPVTPPVTPPIVPPVAGQVWNRLDPGTGAASQVSSYFCRPCFTDKGDLVAIWDAVVASPAQSGVRIFDRLHKNWRVLLQSELAPMPADWPLQNGLPSYRWENNFSDWSDLLGACVWGTTTPTNFANGDEIHFYPNETPARFDTVPHGLGSGDDCGGCWNGKGYGFGFANGAFDQIKMRDLSGTSAQVIYHDSIVPTMGNSNIAWASGGMQRGGINHKDGEAWIFNGAVGGGELWTRGLKGGPEDGLGWIQHPTTGTGPQYGCAFAFVEHLDCYVGFTGASVGQPGDLNPATGKAPTDQGKTFVLPRSSYAWRSFATPELPLTPQTSMSLLYDRFNKETKFFASYGLQVWQLPDAAITGAPIPDPAPAPVPTPAPLPQPGVNGSPPVITGPIPANPVYPFQTVGPSPLVVVDKHWSYRYLPASVLSLCPFMDARLYGSTKHTCATLHNGRQYHVGGDYDGRSYLNGIFSHDVDAGDWALECKPDSPDPRLQHPDTLGVFRDPLKPRFLLVPGVIIGTPKEVYAWNGGESFAKLTTGFPGGNLFGGVIDPVKNRLVFVHDSDIGQAVVEHDLVTFAQVSKTQLPPYTAPCGPINGGGPGLGMHEQTLLKILGRNLYFFTVHSYDGVTYDVQWLKWHLDNHTVTALPIPKFVKRLEMQGGGVQPIICGTKIVYAETADAPGGKVYAMHIFDTIAETWAIDLSGPADLTASGCFDATNGRMWMSGSSDGIGQIKEYVYTP